MRYAHARGAATQTPAGEAVQPEHVDAMAEEGYCNRELMRGGDV